MLLCRVMCSFRTRVVAFRPKTTCLRSAADGGFWDMSGRCVQVSGSRLAFHRGNA